ncbi:protein mono-ADP-ribosyltransferase PARP14-like [Mya arenaria]|uniref:protein mono-ADP-ribosyltransferase PARP14-like n=1 Tax=Mya arenaria TaxID=6604 RepID=UPI0022E02336|nr:protein mono-ADP-ribosyltransferase PARP14-like [Mya arenaria]XP_052771712.1 protein mono-ADP-ribosyltransferase PARP14-like [Mya arenaria]
MSTKRPLPPVPAEAPSGIYDHIDQENPSLLNLPQIDNRAVIVKNLPAAYTKDNEQIQLFFESKKRVGRELDVEDVQIVSNAEAVVTFKTAEDANYILQHHKDTPLVIKEYTIEIVPSVPKRTVRPKKESTQIKEDTQSGQYMEPAAAGGFRDGATVEDDYNSVVVTGFTDDVTDDALRDYFENKRKSGGGDTVDVQVDREGGVAHITFLEKSDAREVVSRTHKLSDCDLTVVPFITSKVEVLFEDLPNTITEDSLKNYVGAKVRGSEVCKVTFNHNRDKAVVLFAENIDIQKVRDACTKYAIDRHHLKPKCIPVTTSIIVYELPVDITHDSVKYYFENTNHSCGDDVLNIDEHFEDGYCIVSFKQASVVHRVCSKRGGHSLSRIAVQVAPYNPLLGLPFGCDVSSHHGAPVIALDKDSHDTHAVQYTEPSAAGGSEDNATDQNFYNSVEVTGFTEAVTDDTLRDYFENKRKSGGGDIVDVQVDREEGVAHITFKHDSDAKEVVSKDHRLCNCDLTVMPFIISKTEVLFEDLPDDCTDDNLEFYIEAKVRESEVRKLTFNQNRDKAVVLFAGNIDIQKVRDACTKYAIDGHHLKPKCIPVTTSIIVFELSENVTHDSVLYYFENTHRSCGNEISKIDEHFEDGYCIVSFKQASVAQRVCSKRGGHSLSGVAVKVALYNRFLGLPFGCEVSSHHDALIITLGKESYDSYKLKFMKSNLSIQNETNALLHTCHAIVNDWGNDPIVVESTLTKDEQGYRKLEKEWESNVTKVITGVFDDISVSKREVAEEAWSAMMKEVRGLIMTYPDDVVFIPEKVNKQIVLVARTNKMDCSWKELTTVINKAIALVKESKEKTTQEVKFSSWKMNYIQKSGFSNGFKNVEISCDEKQGKLIITGSKKDVTDCVLAMYQTIEGTKSKKFEVEPGRSELLKKERIIKYIGRKMKQQGLSDVWEVEKETVILFGDDENDFDKMENIIRNALGKVSVSLAADLLSTAKWKTIEQDLRQKSKDCLVVEYQRDKKELVIFTTSDMEDQVQDAVEEFCEKNSIYKEEFSVEAPTAKFMEKHLKSNFTGELDRLKSNGLVKWEVHANGSIKVEGSSESVKKAKEILNGIARSVHCAPLEIQKRFVKHYFGCKKGQDSLKTVESSVPCVIEAKGSNFNKTVRMGKHQAPQQTFDRPTTVAEVTVNGTKISVVGCDITALSVDVVVNAANRELRHGGGLAYVIQQKGGDEVERDSKDRIRKKGNLRDGEVYMGKPGNLSCKAIAHAVGPRWDGGKKGEDKLLKESVLNCLRKMEKRNFKSIAFPAISAGVYNYPIDLSCHDIMSAIDAYVQTGTCKVTEIIVCDISSNTVKAFKAALCGQYPTATVLQELGDESDRQTPAWLEETGAKGHHERPSSRRRSASRQDSQFGNIKVEVVKAELAKETVDVIVNSASADLKLDRGQSSKAILHAAGESLQAELDNNYPNGIEVGEIAATKSGRMKCRQIYHIAVKHYSSRDHKKSLKQVEEVVSECLRQADQQSYNSVSFPAIGTGGQGYPKADVARQMFSCVSRFATKHPNSSVNHVRFVVYPKDDEVFKAFTEEEGNPQSRKHSASSSSSRQRSDHQRGDITFGNVKVTVVKGDITDHNADAIVASCNKDLNLKKGKVTQSILHKGGDAIRHECAAKQRDMQREGAVLTTAGKLNSKHIIFVDTKYKTHQWKPVVLQCLEMAEEHQLRSIAFPALGTSVGCSPSDMAGIMRSALVDFSKKNVKHLNQMYVVIYQSSMMTDFEEGLAQETKGPSSGRTSKHDSKPQSPRNTDDDSISFTVYAETSQNVAKAKKQLESTVKTDWKKKEMHDIEIPSLNRYQIKELQDHARNNHCHITIIPEKECIEMVGLVSNISDVQLRVFEILRKVDKYKHEKENAEVLASIVKWVYIKNGKQMPFMKNENRLIEQAFKAKEKGIKLKAQQTEYQIDFAIMKEWDISSPKTHYDVLRRDLQKETNIQIPTNWAPMKSSEQVKSIPLSHSDQEYQEALNDLTKTLGRQPKIVSIERIQNPTLYTQYEAKKKQMETANKGTKNERMLWHGTADYAVPSISAHGFNRSYCGKNATAVGQGVYFATQASYSAQSTYSPPDGSGNKKMYRCRVLTGDYTVGNSSMRVPPPKNPSTPHILYDSVTNNTSSPAMFVIFNDTQAYPAHLITFKM